MQQLRALLLIISVLLVSSYPHPSISATVDKQESKEKKRREATHAYWAEQKKKIAEKKKQDDLFFKIAFTLLEDVTEEQALAVLEEAVADGLIVTPVVEQLRRRAVEDSMGRPAFNRFAARLAELAAQEKTGTK